MKFVTMSQQQYNQLLNNLLEEKQALTSLRAQLEGKKESMCWEWFRHLAYNYRTKKKKREGKREKPQNKYKISRVMRSREGRGSIRQQKMKEEVKCFRY